MLLFGNPRRRRGWQSMLGMLTLLVTLSSAVLACSGGGSGSTGTGNSGTTAGVYTVTVTGVSGTTSETGTVTLTMQ